MTLKAMIFIDGSWLFHNKQHITFAYDLDNFEIDYAVLPNLIRGHIAEQTHLEVDIVRVHYFGAIPINRPDFDPTRQKEFYRYLYEKCFYETEIYDIDFKNADSTRPKEKCVDIAVAAAMMFYAAIPGAYDVAVLVAGDRDYLPLIHRTRHLGKRTLLVALKQVGDFYPTSMTLLNNPNLFDFPTLFLDDHLDELRLVRGEAIRECQACGRKETTTWSGDRFFCLECRKKDISRERVCDSCGKSEKTTWTGPDFFCDECRETYRSSYRNNRQS